MTNLNVFNFKSSDDRYFQVRIVVIDGTYWFVAKDVCEILEISNVSMACSKLREKDKGISLIDTPSGDQQMLIVSEHGLYELVLTSRKPEAKDFKYWLCDDVIPAIRKTGQYVAKPKTALELAKEQVLLLEELEVKNQIIEQQKQELILAAPKVQFADAVEATENSISIGDFAKVINWGRNRLFAKLREMDIIMQNTCLPYQRHVDAGFFEVIEVIKAFGVCPVCRITGKGQLWLTPKLQVNPTTITAGQQI